MLYLDARALDVEVCESTLCRAPKAPSNERKMNLMASAADARLIREAEGQSAICSSP